MLLWPLHTSNNRATSNKVQWVGNGMVGWSPWKLAIQLSPPHQQQGLDKRCYPLQCGCSMADHHIFFYLTTTSEISLQLLYWVIQLNKQNKDRKQKYLSKYGNRSTSCWQAKRQKYVYKISSANYWLSFINKVASGVNSL